VHLKNDPPTHSQSFDNNSPIFTDLSSGFFLNLFIFTFSFYTYSLQISAYINSVHNATKFGATCTSHYQKSANYLFHETVAYLGGQMNEFTFILHISEG
jgi:hypothetical protein